MTPDDTPTTDVALAPATSIESLIARAIDRGTPVETMERLLAMRAQLKAEAAREAYFQALAALQSELPIVAKTQAVDYGQDRAKYHYAPFDEIIKVVQPYLFRHGFSVTMNERRDAEGCYAVATAHHIDGHSESSEFPIVVDNAARMNVAQRQASARTYAKRYAYCNVLGIVTGDEDDDAAATGAPPAPQRPAGTLRTEPGQPVTPTELSVSDLKKMWTIARAGGHSEDEVRTWLRGIYHVNSSKEIPPDQYHAICNRLASRAALNEPDPPPVDEWQMPEA